MGRGEENAGSGKGYPSEKRGYHGDGESVKGRGAVEKERAGVTIEEGMLFLDGGEGVRIEMDVAVGSDAMCDEWVGKRRGLGMEEGS